MNPILHTPADGVTFLSISDDRFTTARITVCLYMPLCEETASQYAVLPYLLRRGCREFDSMTAFNRELSRLYGADIDAHVTSSGETQIITLALSCIDDRYSLDGRSVTAPGTKLLLDMLFDPPFENGVFRSEDVEQECRCTLESIAAEINDKRRYAVARCKAVLCEGEPYAVSKYGSKEQVEALTPEILTNAWKTMLKTAPIRIIYQGSGDGKAVKEAFAERLSSRTVSELPPIVRKAARDTVVTKQERMDVNQCQLVLGCRSTIGKDDPLCNAMRVANAVFGGTAHSLLFRHVREEHSLCYYCVSRYDRQKGILMIESGVEKDQLEKALTEILRQLEALKNGDFTDEDLENARLSLLDALASAEDSAAATAVWYGTQELGQVHSPAEVADGVRAVTKADVLAAAATISLDCVFTLVPEEKEGDC